MLDYGSEDIDGTDDDAGEELIRLQRIYNFLLFHAIILSVLDVYMPLYAILYDF